MNDELHISSLLVQHRDEAAAVLDAFAAHNDGFEVAARGERRCVVLCETRTLRSVMDHIDAMLALPGVINVSLIYHHAESLAEMDELIDTHPATTMLGA